MIQLTNEQLQKGLADLFDCQAFELYKEKNPDGSTDYIIPYIMNDALECYIHIKNGSLKGQYLSQCTEPAKVQVTREKSRNVLIVRQGTVNVFTIWFESAWKILHCYQYHSIGHFWVKGQEQWRQLVYLIGTVCDKYDYLGEEVCNAQEMELLPLMGFAPFRMWSPIHESLDDRYPETAEGAKRMYHYAMAAGCRFFACLVKLYCYFPSRLLATFLGNLITRAGMEKMYQLILEDIAAASLPYPTRSYNQELHELIKKNRSDVTTLLHQNGFEGEYPHFYKDSLSVTAAEEHPFTIMEAKDFNFRIQFMVSDCKDGCQIPNAGFFRGKGRSGKIICNLSSLF